MRTTTNMQDARWKLKLLTASDRTATSNMLRHAAALALMFAGRRQKGKLPGEPEIAACFLMDAEDRDFTMHITAKTRIDQVHVMFDVDDAVGPAQGLSIVRIEGDMVVRYGHCGLWSPVNEGRAVLVPLGTDSSGHFSFRKGGPLVAHPGRPASDLEPGFRRAAARFARLVASEEVRRIGDEGFLQVISNRDGVLTTQPTSLAA